MKILLDILFMVIVSFVTGTVSEKETKVELSSACSSLEAAKTVNDEIEKLFKVVSLKEVASPYMLIYGSAKYSHPFDACYPNEVVYHGYEVFKISLMKPKHPCSVRKYPRRDIGYFSDTYYFYLGTVSTYSNSNEVMLRAAERLKRDLSDIAEFSKASWMKVRKIYRLNQGIFEGLDEFFLDSLMQKTAKIFDQAKKDKKSNSNKVRDVKNELTSEFEYANALMRMMPRQILSNPLMLQENLIYSQINSALKGTKHEPLLGQTASIADRIKVFSEFSIKENIKTTTKNLFDLYIKGYNEAGQFSTTTKDIEKRLGIVTEQTDEVTIVKSCEEEKETADEILDEVKQLQNLVGNDLSDLVGRFADGVRGMVPTIASFKFLDEVRRALNFISPIVPQNVHPELDELYSYVTTRADSEEVPKLLYTHEDMQETYAFCEGFFSPYQKLSDMLSKVITVFGCYRKVFQFVGQTVQSCSDGVGNLRQIYDEMSSRISLDEARCWDASLFSRPSFQDMQQTVEKAARKFGFNKECQQNNQQDEPGDVKTIVIHDYSDEAEKERFSPSQRFTVCDLRVKHSLSDQQINDKMKIHDLEKVKAVRCKNNRRSDSMYARENQHDHK